MALSNLPIFPQKIQAWALQLLNATGTTITTLLTAGSNGSVVESLNVTNTDSGVAYTLQFYLNDGTTNHLLGSVNVPLSSGNTTAAPAVDILRQGLIPGVVLDANGNYVLNIPSGYALKVAVTVAVTAAKVVDVVAMGSDY